MSEELAQEDASVEATSPFEEPLTHVDEVESGEPAEQHLQQESGGAVQDAQEAEGSSDEKLQEKTAPGDTESQEAGGAGDAASQDAPESGEITQTQGGDTRENAEDELHPSAEDAAPGELGGVGQMPPGDELQGEENLERAEFSASAGAPTPPPTKAPTEPMHEAVVPEAEAKLGEADAGKVSESAGVDDQQSADEGSEVAAVDRREEDGEKEGGETATGEAPYVVADGDHSVAKEAEQEASSVVEEAEQEASPVVEEAEQEASPVVEEAEQETSPVVEAAETRAAALLQHAARGALRATPEIQRQRALSDAIAESLEEGQQKEQQQGEGRGTERSGENQAKKNAGSNKKKKKKKKRGRVFTDGKSRFFPHGVFEGRIYDQFLVVGLQEDTHELLTKYSGRVVYEYPPERALGADVAPFCFPGGAVARRIRRTNSASALHEVLYGREDSVTDRFVFMLSQEDGSFRYGICVRRPQLLGIVPSFVGDSGPLSAEAKFYPAADSVYCLISRFPFFSLHFDVLFGILAQERLHRFSNDVFSQEPRDDALAAATTEGLNASLQILEQFSRVEIPRPGHSVSFTVPSTMRTVSFEYPKGDVEAKIFGSHCLATVFELLTMDNILLLFNALMLEKQIVLISKSLGVLSATSLAAVAMLRPFTWMGLFIVPLPESLVDAVTAPVPFIVGLQDLPAQLRQHVDLIINLDDNRAMLPKGKFPALAADRLLVSNLKLQHELLFKRKVRKYPDHTPFLVSPEHGPAIASITSAFHSYTQWLADKFVACFRVNKEIDSMKLMRETFLPSVSHGNRQFISQFLQSQQVSVFMESLFRERNESDG